MQSEYVLEFKNITMRFSGVLALDNVSLGIRPGEVHALIGENGAGKSTLIKCCTGANKPTEGTVVVNGQEFRALTPQKSQECGIGVVYQEFNLIDELPVYENIFLGNTPTKGIAIDKKKMIEVTQELLQNLGINIKATSLIKDLTVGYQQLVEIAKAISKEVKVLIMDEPTAPLTDPEVEAMFEIVNKLKASGVAIIYVSHRLDEIFKISDRVTVLRDGEYVCTKATSELDKNELIRLMVGRDLKETYPKRPPLRMDENILEVKHLTGNGVEDISFELKRGEILGFGGLIGAGRTELAHLLFGVKKFRSGEITKNGKTISPKNPEDAVALGIALVPEDRKTQGVCLHMSVRENMTLPVLKKISKFSVINKKRETELVEEYKDSIRIKAANLDMLVKKLSGGNQQKVVLAKWLTLNPDILIFDEPTRGIDVGARFEIYQLMNQLVSEGKSIIMISSDMEELLGMSDRILVLSEGHLTGELSKDEFSQEKVMQYATKIG